MTRSWTIAALTALTVAATANAQTLTERLDRRLDAPGMEHLFWGVSVTDIDGRPLYGRNADKLFVPASNTKLVVSIIANALLGPQFTTTTSVYGTGPVSNGVVQGDLVLYGRGDPTFSNRCYNADTTLDGACDRDPAAKLRDLALQLRARGIRTVAGDLVGDGSYFEAEVIHPGWESYDLAWWYAAPVSGLGFNDNAVDFHEVAGDSIGAAPQLIVTPALGAYALENRAVVGSRDSRRTFDIFRNADGLGYLATGSLPAGMKPRDESAAVLDPNRYAVLAFRHELARAGIRVLGDTRSTVDSFTYRAARSSLALAAVHSRPLHEWLYPILSPSQNWFAEMLLKQLGKRSGGGGSWEAGLAVEKKFLVDSVRIDSLEFSLQDGSGLSSSNFVTPHAFTKLLVWARKHPNFAAIDAGLPQSGKPGTLKERFVGTPAATAVHAKTGSISGVNTLSGYVERTDGSIAVFSVMANHHTLGGSRMIAAIDSVVVELVKP